MSLEQLPELPHRRPVCRAGHHVLLQTPHERVDPLVLEQRLHEQIVGGAVMAHEGWEEPLLFLAKVPQGLHGVEAEEGGDRLAALVLGGVGRAPQSARFHERVMVVVRGGQGPGGVSSSAPPGCPGSVTFSCVDQSFEWSATRRETLRSRRAGRGTP